MSPTKSPTKSATKPARNPGRPARGAATGRVARIEPRLEARRIAHERSGSRRRLWRVGIVLVVLAVVAGAWFVLHSSLLSARVVTVTGRSSLPASAAAPSAAASTPSQRAAVLGASGLASRPPLIDVDPGAVSARVQRLAWVGAARVQRHWPDGVTVEVGVRRPVAVVTRAPGGYAEVDRTGRVLGDVPTVPPGLVQVQPAVHPAVRPGAVGAWLPRSVVPALQVAASLPPALSGQVAVVVAQPQGQVDLQLTSPLTVALGTATQLHQKYEDAAAILAGASLQAGDVVNVTVPGSPLVVASSAG